MKKNLAEIKLAKKETCEKHQITLSKVNNKLKKGEEAWGWWWCVGCALWNLNAILLVKSSELTENF